MKRIEVSVLVAGDAATREQAYDIRRRVFTVEQGVAAEEEFDDDDLRATHVLATVGDDPAGTGRIVFHPGYAKIGRMAVLKNHRRHGVGRAIIERLVQIGRAQGAPHLVLHAQVQAIPFYESVGFLISSAEFTEAGIPHRRMERSV